MNKGFIKLENGKTIVTSETGDMTERGTNIGYDALLLENKIELVDESISYLEEEIDSKEGIVYVSNGMMLIQLPLVIIELLFVCFNLINGFGFCYAISANVFLLSFFGVLKMLVTNISLKKLNYVINKLNLEKNELEKKLQNVKMNTKEEIFEVNTPVSLAKATDELENLLIDKVDNYYREAMHTKVLKRVKK